MIKILTFFQVLDKSQIIVSTALASRGTDIRVSNQMNELGGLHVLLTYLPKDTRTERQIIGRTGRSGQPGSSRLILNQEALLEQLGEEFNDNNLKDIRDSIEINRIEGLKCSLNSVKFQEKLFSTFCKKLQDFMSNFSIYEQGDMSEKYSSSTLNCLLKELDKRQLDFEPAVKALKESWALWYSLNSDNIYECSRRNQSTEMTILEKKLNDFLDEKSTQLLEGSTPNFYHFIDHAIGRSHLYENHPSVGENFVISAWKKVEDQIKNNRENKYISAAFYNQAYYIMKKDPKKSEECLKLLNKAKEAFDETMRDTFYDSQLYSRMNFAGKPHTEFEETNRNKTTNIFLQCDDRSIIYETFLKNTVKLIDVIEKKQKESDLALVDVDVNEMFKAEADPILSKELSLFANDGHFQCFDLKEEPKKNRWTGCWVFLLGLGQVVGGVLLCTFSAGAASSFGLNLIMEGISDCIDGVKGMVTGTLTWVQYAIGKAISIGTSLLCWGVGKAMKWFKPVSNVVTGGASKVVSGITTQGAKQSFKQCLKYTAKTLVTQIAVNVVDFALEEAFQTAINGIFSLFKDNFSNFIRTNQDIEKVLISIFLAKRKGKEINENLMHILSKDIQEHLIMIVDQGYQAVTYETWGKVSKCLITTKGPLLTLANKHLSLDKAKYISLVKHVVNLSVCTANAAIAIKEMVDVKSELASNVIQTCEVCFELKNMEKNSQEWNEFVSDPAKMKYVTECVEVLAEKFGSKFLEKVTSMITGVFNATLKSYATQKVNNRLTNLSKIYKQQGYFKEKRHEHKQFTMQVNPKAMIDPSNGKSCDEILNEREGKPADAVDIRAAEEKLGKKIIVDTCDENGKIIKSDKSAGGYISFTPSY